jgi:hypothetical protein
MYGLTFDTFQNRLFLQCSEMDPAEIRLIEKVVIKDRGAEGLEKSARPYPLSALKSFLIDNYATIQM